MSRVEDEPRRKIKDKCIYGSYKQKLRFRFRFMVFNTTFNNISVILWRSVLLVEETRVPRENHRLVASLTNFKDKKYVYRVKPVIRGHCWDKDKVAL